MRPVSLLAISLLLAACAGTAAGCTRTPAAGTPDPTAAAPAGRPVSISVTAEQWRVHEVNRQLAIALHNNGATPVRVSRVEPDLPSFEGESGVDTDALLPVGGLRVDVPVPFGAGGCNPAEAAASRVVVTARPEGTADWQRVTLDLPHPNPLLDKLLAADCAAQRVRDSVTLAFGPWQDLGPDGVRGSLEITRTSAAVGTVRITELDGNVLYRLAFPRGGTAEVSAARPAAAIPIVVTPLRCDLHAFAEVKKPFEFPVHVALDGREPLAGTVGVDEDDKTALDTMLRRICKVP
ncbi:hypothetical protein [Actinoplanes missouriensis]|uniref:hypothetical protein n=1 Tax=Actinoplanes missouriensis TaxID=1866 RepID=UPI0005A296C4|nr:hypothetical protein [Actinoplanes missouriensis]